MSTYSVVFFSLCLLNSLQAFFLRFATQSTISSFPFFHLAFFFFLISGLRSRFRLSFFHPSFSFFFKISPSNLTWSLSAFSVSLPFHLIIASLFFFSLVPVYLTYVCVVSSISIYIKVDIHSSFRLFPFFLKSSSSCSSLIIKKKKEGGKATTATTEKAPTESKAFFFSSLEHQLPFRRARGRTKE